MENVQICKPSFVGEFNSLIEAWNNPALDESVNCLAFALNCPQAGRAMPGQLVNVQDVDFSDKLIRTKIITDLLVEHDKLVPVSEEDALSGKFHCVALRINENSGYENFHFIGGSGNTWFQKLNMGTYLPSNRDDDLLVINNPRTSYDAQHPDFGGYFAIPEDGIPYAPVLKL